METPRTADRLTGPLNKNTPSITDVGHSKGIWGVGESERGRERERDRERLTAYLSCSEREIEREWLTAYLSCSGSQVS